MRTLVPVDRQHARSGLRSIVPAALGPIPFLISRRLDASRVLLRDVIVGTMESPSFADSGAGVLAKGVRSQAPGVRVLQIGVLQTVLRPFPLEPISGRRTFWADPRRRRRPTPVLVEPRAAATVGGLG